MNQHLVYINKIKKKLFFCFLGWGVIFALFLIVSNVTIKEISVWMCVYTGSWKSKTSWLYLVGKDKYEKSPLEEWLKSNNKKVEHKWVKIAGSKYYVFSLLRSHSSAPPIYSFDHNSQRLFVATTSEENIEAFLDCLKTKSEDSQLATIRSIIEKQ